MSISAAHKKKSLNLQREKMNKSATETTKKYLNKVKQSDDDDNVDDSGAGCCYCYLRELTFVNWVILTEWEQSIQRGPLVVCALFHYKTLPLSTDSFLDLF